MSTKLNIDIKIKADQTHVRQVDYSAREDNIEIHDLDNDGRVDHAIQGDGYVRGYKLEDLSPERVEELKNSDERIDARRVLVLNPSFEGAAHRFAADAKQCLVGHREITEEDGSRVSSYECDVEMTQPQVAQASANQASAVDEIFTSHVEMASEIFAEFTEALRSGALEVGDYGQVSFANEAGDVFRVNLGWNETDVTQVLISSHETQDRNNVSVDIQDPAYLSDIQGALKLLHQLMQAKSPVID